MNLPERFDLTYISEDGSKKRPIMIHRVIFGSLERFIGILIEHFAGAFPLWLSPVQVDIIPVNNKYHLNYAKELQKELESKNIRVKLNDKEEKLGYKIRESQTKKMPYTLVIGDSEIESKSVTYRIYGTEKQVNITKEEFISKILNKINNKDIDYNL